MYAISSILAGGKNPYAYVVVVAVHTKYYTRLIAKLCTPEALTLTLRKAKSVKWGYQGYQAVDCAGGL